MSPQVMIHDLFLYDPVALNYTVDRFLADVEARYGGVDSILLWQSYPNIGCDDRNQFQMLMDTPGGPAGLASLVQQFHDAGVRVLYPYNPWDQGTSPAPKTDDKMLADALAGSGGDGFNGDTMNYISRNFFDAGIAVGHPIAIEPEIGPTLSSLEYVKMGWGYWEYPFVPSIDLWKWLERRHRTHVCDRWATNHTDDLHAAFFNGIGFVSWENVWGIWNQMSPRDAELLRRMASIQRFAPDLWQSESWEPHTTEAVQNAGGVFASRWVNDSAIYAPNASVRVQSTTKAVSLNPGNGVVLWSLVNRGTNDFPASTPQLVTACAGQAFFDLYHGVALTPSVSSGGQTCTLSFAIEPLGVGAVLAVPAGAQVPSLPEFLRVMSAMTAVPLANFSTANTILPQTMTPVAPTTPFPTAPAGMVRIPGNASWLFYVTGNEIEGPPGYPVDIQYPWESAPNRTHTKVLSIPTFYIDQFPVTNGAFATFLAASKYTPRDPDAMNFLRSWNRSGGTPQPAAGSERQPVAWVDLDDARAYCAFYGKRLPNDWEWQFAAQGSDGRLYPWGSTWNASCVPAVCTNRTMCPFDDVDAHPCGMSPFGVMDLVGNVYQWTNEFADIHTRSATVRGGNNYQPQTSGWYFRHVRAWTLRGQRRGGRRGSWGPHSNSAHKERCRFR